MIKLIIFHITAAALLAGSYDIEECENWYKQAQDPKSDFVSIFKHYSVSRCYGQADQKVKIVLNGMFNNRICYVLISGNKFEENKQEQLDCFKFFKAELPRAKERHAKEIQARQSQDRNRQASDNQAGEKAASVL